MAAWAASRGIPYLDGAIMVPTPLVGTPDALILVSGPQAAFDAHRATLQTLAGNLHYLGADTSAAALYAVAMLDIFHTTMASMVHALALVAASGIAPSTFASFAAPWIAAIVPPIFIGMANSVEAGEHPGLLDKVQIDFLRDLHERRAFEPFATDELIEDILAAQDVIGRQALERWLYKRK
ncbi:MAG: hypothetical protein L0271_16875 [Gemmatimonadetes bacterium]|nr:hypothetical protein [Gemmatimonadota bacterium]